MCKAKEKYASLDKLKNEGHFYYLKKTRKKLSKAYLRVFFHE